MMWINVKQHKAQTDRCYISWGEIFNQFPVLTDFIVQLFTTIIYIMFASKLYGKNLQRVKIQTFLYDFT